MIKTAAQDAYAAWQKTALQRKEVEELARDLGEQMSVYGLPSTLEALPSQALKRRVQEVEAGSDAQTLAGIGGALGGGAAGAGIGALTTGLAKGRHAAPFGALSGIPGALLGFSYFKDLQRRRELEKALQGSL